MEQQLYAYLDAELGFAVAWGELGADTSLPRAAIYRLSGTPQQLLTGPGLMQGRIQVDCYGASYAQANGAEKAVRAALEYYQSGAIQGVFLEAVRDLTDDDAGLLHRVSLTFAITYRE